MQEVKVGKFTVKYSPEIQFATVCKPGLLVPEVIKQFDLAKEWAVNNQDKG